MTERLPLLPIDPAALVAGHPETWRLAVEAANPSAVLAWIDLRLGPALRGVTTAEDLWQETLLRAFQGRAALAWDGPVGFRRWLMRVAENRIRDLVDRVQAKKRGGGAPAVPVEDILREGSGEDPIARAALEASTTPSRVAMHRERARLVRDAIARLPDELREVYVLRVVEGCTNAETAARLGLGESGAKHRFYRAARLCEPLLRQAFGSSFTAPTPGA